MSKRTLTFLTVLSLLLVTIALAPVAAQDDLIFPIGEGPFHWEDLDRFNEMDLSGQEVRLFTPWLTVDEENVTNMLAYFEEATGATVIHSGSDSFEQQIVVDVQAGSPPDIAVFPQPGLAANLAEQGYLVPLSDDLHDFILNNYAAGQSWVDLSTYAGEDGESRFFALPFKIDVKSLVWYVPDNFEEAGYEVPTTMEELMALSQQIVDDGGTPWCIGLGSGDATGWPATDWVEDIMLRTASPEVYDQWVSHEIPFNDPAVVNAIDVFGSIAKNDAWVNGGATAVASTDFRDSPAGLFTVPPECYLHHQASFIPSFFPEGTEMGTDVDFFYMPAYASEDLGNPVLGAGTLWTITQDADSYEDVTEATRALMEFLTTKLASELWMAQSGFLTPLQGVNLDAYSSDALRGQGEILLNATTFRFDGSDLMPGAVGAGAFWREMVNYVSSPDMTAEEAATAIEDAWQAMETSQEG
ncbi:MAG: ABC transporter substrate-binding protein [Anaerolineae bacterium]|nr:ABC transporter substrate-binding protein [Anaerolineae bacterium]